MAFPNPIEPEDHGEELGGRSAAEQAHEQQVLDALTADMEGSTAEKLAAQLLTPVVPDGGTVGRTVAPHVDRVTKTRDGLWLWGPAAATTTGAVVAVAVLPLPGPLALYVLALAAFAWWHCAGRPGISESVRMLAYALADTGAWIRRHIEQLARRRAAMESRRTAPGAPTTEKGN
ncbi:hypothetical protein IU459_13145 [Nocardia amamiensis]|uniref:Uncharacterized protein n=1 Tax=Nocardia amamiensis TaxID=404578 RepID=A0ABS0CPI9_9NOCA|nr:hypothetical protein [Nocardia amamiensis]MBF6298485.1 hypothetical protein [Nocardia amamiensis]